MVIFYHLSIRSPSAFSLSWTFRWDLQDNTSGSLTRINFPPLPGRYNYLLSPPWLWVLISCSVPLISILKLSSDNWEIRFSCTEVWHHIGRSKRIFKTRLGEHLGYIGNENSEEPSRLHFSLPGHNKHHLQGLAIEQVRSKDPFVIKAREHKYIQLFDSYRRGLNQEP